MTTVDISQDPVFGIGYSSTSSSGSLWSNSGFQYEWAVAGKPFLSVASDEYQMIRSFVQVNKQQFDNRDDPGEQTLTGWWIRSQRDFSCGAGQLFFEANQAQQSLQDARVLRKFYSSRGVDVWTPGEATLLPAMSLVSGFTSVGTTDIVSADDGSTSYIYGLTGTGVASTQVKRWDGTTVSAVTGWTAAPTSLASTGNAVLGFHSTGIDISNASGSTVTQQWTHALGAGYGWWVKERIIAAFGSDLYALPLGRATGSAPFAVITSGASTDKICAGEGGWTWTSVTAAPGAILAAGYRGSRSAIYSFSVSNTGVATPLSSPVTVAEMPNGEVIKGIRVYLGAFITIVTSSGVRIGTVSADGTVTFGPLTYSNSTVYGDIAAYDRFIYVGASDVGNGTAGCIRIDLSEMDDAGRCAWANDVDTGVTGDVDAVYMFGTTDRVIIGINASGVYQSSTTVLAATGELVTSKIRYSTLEPKTFQLMSVKGTTTDGTIAVSSLDIDNDPTSLYTLSSSSTAEFGLSNTDPVEYFSAKFSFTRSSTDSTKGPTLRGWQTKALPAVTRKQQWRLPLLCFDNEQDRFGNKSGASGSGLSRYQALRAALLTGVPVILQDLVGGESFTVLVEDVQFVQTSPPRNASGFGGVAIIVCREL